MHREYNRSRLVIEWCMQLFKKRRYLARDIKALRCRIRYSSESIRGAVVQIILEIALTIGFIPTVLGIIRDPSCEPPFVWFIWSATFVLQFLVVELRKGKMIEFLYPVNMFWLHLLVSILALRWTIQSRVLWLRPGDAFLFDKKGGK